MRSPTHWGTNSTFKTSNSKHLNFFWLLQQKRLNLDIWWFEIGAPVELWGPPRIGGPIPPSQPQIQNTHQKIWLLQPKWLNLVVWWFEIGAPVELWGPSRVVGPILPSKPQIQNTNKKIWLLQPKWLNLDVWWFETGALVELWGPPRVGGPIPPLRPQIQNTNKKIWLLQPKWLNLDVWWFEIRALVELWGPPCVGGPIPPSKPQNQNTYKKCWLVESKWLNLDVGWFEIGALVELWGPACWGSNSTFKTLNSKHPPKKFGLWNKTTKFKCLVIWNWVLTSTAWCCNLRSKQFALKNLIFTSSNFLESYPRWEKEKGERNESLWALYTICYATWTYKKWGGNCHLILEVPHPSGWRTPTPRRSVGLVGKEGSRGVACRGCHLRFVGCFTTVTCRHGGFE
jgi:hypothetical protein